MNKKLLFYPLLMFLLICFSGYSSKVLPDYGNPTTIIPGEDSLRDECYASFNFLPDNQLPLTFHFQNTSTGEYDVVHWDFGDNHQSGEENPTHTYEEPGLYNVCLTILSQDSLYGCSDMDCQAILAGDTTACRADFIAVLDTLNIEPNFYHFFDQSVGNINSWHWDFGDGTSSAERNPVHHYLAPGPYQVCLMIENNQNPAGCSDMECKEISTPSYYSLGGLVYAGDYPLNNPYPQGDTGIAYLFRINENRLLPAGVTPFSDLGYFWFVDVMEGIYVVKVALTPGSTHFSEYFPTYFDNKLNWHDAIPFNLNDSNFFTANIYLAPVLPLAPGPGKINGTIDLESHGILTLLPFSEIMLANEDKFPLTFTYSDPNGNFSFMNLAFGKYYLIPDIPGKFADSLVVVLTQQNPTAESLHLVVHEEALFGIEEPPDSPCSILSVYPNPVRDILHIEIGSKTELSINVSLTDLAGRSIIRQSYSLNQGNQTLSIPLAELSPGIYLVIFRSPKGLLLDSRKIIK